uniref:Uncharacterized protein n=1 Tax=uncultured marine group II/III euryarchaeote AD1000_03_F11 TaxID=1457703 RepID=A0A075FL52_9EURY|nr:hypothetical protein [uncultured marine group II/III euryarchaeote AD1000_03_F11]
MARYSIPNTGLLGHEQGCLPPHTQADAVDSCREVQAQNHLVLVSSVLLRWNLLPSLRDSGNYRNSTWPVLCPRGRRYPVSGLPQHGVHHDRVALRLYHQVNTPLDDALHGRRSVSAHVQGLLHRCLQESSGAQLAHRCRPDVLHHFLWLLGLYPTLGQSSLWSGHYRNQHGQFHTSNRRVDGQGTVCWHHTEWADSH